MKAAVLTEYGRIEWREVPRPAISDDQVLVKVGYAGICGSDMHIFGGEFHPRTSLPLIQGHEFGGTIVEAGSKVADYKAGDRVTVDPIYWCGGCPACELGQFSACKSLKLVGIDSDGGFGEYAAVKDFMLHRVGDNVSDRHAAMVEMFGIGFHACGRAGVKENDTLAIFGGGRIGHSILQAARTKTKGVIFVVDILPSRLQVAEEAFGDVITINALQENPVDTISRRTGGRGVDVAFEAVGHAYKIEGRKHPVAQCVDSVRSAAVVCVLGQGNEAVSLLMRELVWKELKLITSRVSCGEFAEAIEHLRSGDLQPDALISAEFPASEAQRAFELLKDEPENYLKILLRLN